MLYNEPLNGCDVKITIYDEYFSDELKSQATKICTEYKFNIAYKDNLNDTLSELQGVDDYLINHFIIRFKHEFCLDRLELLVQQFDIDRISGSIVYSYPDCDSAKAKKELIDLAKKRYGDNINYIRPNTYINGLYSASPIKILDNIICDTIRVKYKAIKLQGRKDIPSNIKNFFYDCSRYYEQYKMYHRSASDGYFAHRDEDGFWITSTKTFKDSRFNESRISFVSDVDFEKNTVSYVGQYLPSSDSIEAAVLFIEEPTIQSLFHTHDSNRIDEMSLEFANHSGRSLCFRDGQMYQLPDLDQAFGDDEDMRWLSLYIACDGSNLMPRHFSNKIERLRLINLFLKLRYPQCVSILTPIPILLSDY